MKPITENDFLLPEGFCPDGVLDIESPEFPERIHRMEQAVGFNFACIKCVKRGLNQVIAEFAENGGKSAVHHQEDVAYAEATDMELTPIFKKAMDGQALTQSEIAAYKTGLLLHCAKQYGKFGIAMEASFADEKLTQALREV